MLTTHKNLPGHGTGLGLFCLLLLPFLAFSTTRFTNVTLQLRAAECSHFGGHGVCWVDVNKDGKLDLYSGGHLGERTCLKGHRTALLSLPLIRTGVKASQFMQPSTRGLARLRSGDGDFKKG
jgi:hypothetical protein